MEFGASRKIKTATIDKLVFGGYGLGRGEGGVVLIPGVASGETVEYEDDGLRGGVPVGRVAQIIKNSPKRRDMPCVYAGECGGCDWLHLRYDEQIRSKKEVFIDCVNRIGKIDHPGDIEMFFANEFGYRIRAQIKIDHLNKRTGFYRRNSNDLVKIDKCPLLCDEINNVLMELNMGMVSSIPDDVKTIKVLSGGNTASYPAIKGLTSANTEITVSSIRFLVDGGSFFQSNGYLLETLGKWADAHIGGKICFDLYGGVGFFSLMLSDNFSNIILAENMASQVKAAEQNFKINGKNNCKAVLIDVEKGNLLDKLTKTYHPDCIIVDPPRPGLAKNVRKWLIDVKPKTILYVSCNPSTFARDAGALVKGGYKLAHWALFDMYPNTHHIESAAVFLQP